MCVPVVGTCSTMRVQGYVGGGGRLQVVWHLHEEGTRAHHVYHAKPSSTPTYACEKTHKRHEQKWLVAGNANVTSKSMASDTFNCKLPRCERATLYGIPPSVWTMFLHMYEPSLAKLVGGVMATCVHSRLDVEVEPCCTESHEGELERV